MEILYCRKWNPYRDSNGDEHQNNRIIGRCGATHRQQQVPSRDAHILFSTLKFATSWVFIQGEGTKSIANFYNQQLASNHVFYKKSQAATLMMHGLYPTIAQLFLMDRKLAGFTSRQQRKFRTDKPGTWR